MTYDRFEDLPVWKAAVELGRRIYALTNHPYFKQDGDLCDQLRRAALSISNNIAEGFERGSTAELLAFLYYARGSAGEVRSMLQFMNGLQGSEALGSLAELIRLCESCSRQIRGWANQLQNSEIRGQRHLNDQTRQESDQRKRAVAFRQKIQDMLSESKPEIYEKKAPSDRYEPAA